MSSSYLRAAVFLLVCGFSTRAFAAAPAAATVAASGITTSSAVLNGTGTPNGEATTGRFRYSTTNPGTCNDTFGTRVPTSGGTDLGTGTSAVPYSITTTGLTPGTTYYFCAIVSNGTGTALGTIMQFTIPAAPVVVSSAPTMVTSSSATLQGTGNPLTSTTTGWFRYANTSPGMCNDTFGNRIPYSSGGSNLGAGIAPVAYTQPISGLTPATTYYYCAIASNSYGTGFGALMSFTTPATAPVVSTSGASNLTRTTGTLNGYANPGGDATNGWFRYATASPGTCNDTFGTRSPTTGGSMLGSGASSVSYSQNITGLSPGITYYYCAIAQNSMGTAWGSVQTFVTPSAPTATTTAATYITNTTAQLNGSGNPNRASANGYFRYALTAPMSCNDTFGSRAPTSGGTSLGSDIYDTPYSQSVSGLSPATTYYYCAIVTSTEGTAFGSVMTFVTATAATATTTAATGISSSGATLNGAGNPMSGTATGWFRWANTSPGTCNDSFGTRVPYSSGGANLGSGTTSMPFTYGISGLSPATTYYYCAIVSNGYGTGFGAVLSFTTPAMMPTVQTSSAVNLTRTTATLTGYGNPGGDATSAWFRYSAISPGTCNDSFGTRAPAMSGSALGNGSANVSFQQNITGLSAATTYYYCALAQNSMGTVLGSVYTFITPSAPTATTTPATSITTSSAQLNGSGNPNRASATGWFRYSTTAPMSCNDTFGSRAPVTGSTSLGSDIYDTPFYQSISGLSSGTTYYYCAIVSSSEGTAFGAVTSFVTSGAPTATTSAATTVTSTSATLNGSGNPNLGTATGWFRWATTSPGTCNDSFGTRVPYSSGGTNLGAGSTSVPFYQGIGSLSPATTYYYCAIVNNSYGTGFGAVLSFTTPSTAPTVQTSSAVNLTRTTGTLTGYGNPGGDATTGWFRYSAASPGTCNDSFGTRAPAMSGSALGNGNANVSFQQNITGLSPNTTYYYCALAQNSMGTVMGSVYSFITPSAPTATTTAATSITTSSAQLNGSGNPNRASASGWFRYATTAPMSCNDTFGSRAPVTGATSLGSDIYDTPFYQPISGLSSGTTYYYCAIVSSTEGTAFGAVMSFVTSGAPTATTNAATSITSTSATLNGSGNPNLGTATGWFRWATTSPGTCNDSFGNRVPYSSGGTNLGAGSTSVPFYQGIGSLSPGSTYYYCAIVNNSYGTSFGAVMSFTTPAQAPTVQTSSAVNLTRTTGTLTAYANPGGDATTGWFRYSISSPGTCNDSFGTRAPAMSGSALGNGNANVSFQQNITGLSANTTYYYCAMAQNSIGTVFGTVYSFITPSAPTATTTAATYVTNTSAQLNGSGNPNRSSANGWFRYATTAPMSCNDTFGSRAPVSGTSSLGSDIYDTPFYQPVSGLSPSTTYYYCAIVSSTEGTAFGAVMSFTTAAPPTATTVAATSVTSTSATLNGSGNPNGGAATGWFRWATTSPGTCNDSFGNRVPYSSGGANLGAGSAVVGFTQPIGSLTPGGTYYYCAIVSNTYGTTFGAVLSFTTPSQAPTVSTSSAINLTRTTGTLTGYGNPGGDATNAWFRYATASPGTCNDTFGTRAPAMAGSMLGSGTANVSFQQNITGLTEGTTYYYCAIAQNSNGTAWGSVYTFITPTAPTALTTAATSITTNSATLNGSGNPNRASATGWFRYATTAPMACNDTFGSRAPTSGGSSLGSDIYDTTYSQSISGLSPATTYYFCAIVSSTEGTAFGTVLTFTTSAPATASTAAATSVTSTTATLNGAGNPNGGAATGWFRYSTSSPGTCNDSFGTRVPYSSGGTNLGAGTSNVTFAQAITGLSPGVTYYYCAIASNTYGTGLGGIVSFTTPASLPSVITDYPSGVSIVLNGTVNPNGAATSGWFRIATSSPGTCNDTFGTRAPTTGGTSLGAGAAYVAYSAPAPTLTPGTTYYYCAIASNAVGTSFGVIRSFVAPMPPTVSTLAATPVTATTATLNGSGNPNGNSTMAWFRYSTSNPGTCNDVFGTRTPASGGDSLGSGTTVVTFAEPISGLSAATTYYFCAIASSTYGTSLGTVLSFTTPPTSIKNPGGSGDPGGAASKVTTVAATNLGSEVVTLNGTANPLGEATTGYFRYDTRDPEKCNDSFGTRAPLNGGGTELGSKSKPVDYSQTISGLSPATKYYFCALASTANETSFGAVLTVTTKSAPPSVKTLSPTEVSKDSAMLNAQVVPNGEATTTWFRYGTNKPEDCNESFGDVAPREEARDLGAGISAVSSAVVITDLSRGATYYYCAIARSTLGTAYGEIMSFTVGADAPSVDTEAPAKIDSASATVSSTVDSKGSPTKVWYRIGETEPATCDDSYGKPVIVNPASPRRTPIAVDSPLGAEVNLGPHAMVLEGLSPGATYYYCAAASNQGGAVFGKVRSFTTAAAAPAPIGPQPDTVAPANAGGCSYSTNANRGNMFALLAAVSMLGLLTFRRRRRAKI